MKRAYVVLVFVLLCACDHHVHQVPLPLVSGDPPVIRDLPATTAAAPETTSSGVATSSPPEPPARVEPPSLDMARVVDELNGRLQDVFFMFDSSDLAPDALAVVQGDADLLKTTLTQFPKLSVTVEGHCDERGSAEYNLGLGDRRARRVGDALHDFAVLLPGAVIISYGKEAPQCTEATESCWQRNRRAHIVVKVGQDSSPAADVHVGLLKSG